MTLMTFYWWQGGQSGVTHRLKDFKWKGQPLQDTFNYKPQTEGNVLFLYIDDLNFNYMFYI